MPRVHDPALVRRILESDRPWAVYMLADLEPPYAAHCEWYAAAGDEPALALVYRGLGVPVLVAMGSPPLLRPVLAEAARDGRIYLSVRYDALPLVEEAGYAIKEAQAMCRMLLDPARFPACDTGAARRLGPADANALQELFSDGEPRGEAPVFFDASMLERGVYYGIREDGRLVAAAGTHVLSRMERVAAIGNVYTRHDRRGRGLARCVTAATVAELLAGGPPTIALNVAAGNAAAIRVYGKLGFAGYCEYCEGLAIR